MSSTRQKEPFFPVPEGRVTYELMFKLASLTKVQRALSSF